MKDAPHLAEPRHDPPHDVADLLSEAFAGHTMQRVRTPDGRYRYSYVSAGIRDSLGLDPDYLMALDAADHSWVHPEDRGSFLEALEQSAAELTRFDVEVRVERGSGNYRWVRSIGDPRKLADNTIIWDGAALDVTDRREALDALQKTVAQVRANETSEARFSYIAANDVSDSLNALGRAISELDDGTSRATAVKARFSEFTQTLSAARGLVNQSAAKQAAGATAAVRLDVLTDKQRAVLERLGSGESNRAIAESMGITEGTVKLHISAILKRLGAKNRTEAALKWRALTGDPG